MLKLAGQSRAYAASIYIYYTLSNLKMEVCVCVGGCCAYVIVRNVICSSIVKYLSNWTALHSDV